MLCGCFFISEDEFQRRLETDRPAADSAVGCETEADADRDGHDNVACGGDDCDDTRPKLFPGATELCNALDDDCNDLVDDEADCPCTIEYYDASTYQYCTVAADWDEAAAACEAVGYHLVEVDDAAENAAIYSIISRDYASKPWWLGLSDAANEGVWRWEAGDIAGYTKWHKDQPSDLGGYENCAEMNNIELAAKEAWNDAKCTYENYYICEAG